MALVLPASRSRAAWLAVCISTAWLLLFKYPMPGWFRKYLNTSLKRVGVILLIVILTGACLSGLYFYKKGSADGRTLVWKVTLDMIRDHPITGVGFDQFKAHYMDYQAGYFEKAPGLEEGMVAGDSNYAFNELLQQTAENGVVGLALILVVLIAIFTSSFHPSCNHKKSDQLPGIHNKDDELSVIAKAGIVSIFVFSLFSYPAQILPIKTSLVFYLAVVAGLTPQKTISLPEISNKGINQLVTFFLKITLTLILLVGIIAGYKFGKRYYQAYQDWQSAFQVPDGSL
jgi:O-antigen ligase